MTPTSEETLIKQYGPLLSINQLATSLIAPQMVAYYAALLGEWVSKINATRLRLGRRVYFRTAEVAKRAWNPVNRRVGSNSHP